MAGTVRYTERSYMSELLLRDPDFYADRRNGHEYEFSNGRKFKQREPYESFGPFDYTVYLGEDPVFFGEDPVLIELDTL